MMFRRLGLINREQRGFTLVEILVALAITGLIVGGIAVAIIQVFSVNASASNRMTAVRQVQSAGYYISRDAEMAQDVNTDDNPGTIDVIELVSLRWTDWNGVQYQSDYTINVDDRELKRSYTAGGQTTENIIARYIDPDTGNTNCQMDEDRLVLTITASIEGFKPASETRVYEVIPRPSV